MRGQLSFIEEEPKCVLMSLREEYYKFLEEKNIIAEISNVEDEEEDYEPTD